MSVKSLRQIASISLVSVALLGVWGNAQAVEYPIGRPQQVVGMQIAAVYLQPVVMEPEGMMRDAKDSIVHLEADISALASNVNGIPEGALAGVAPWFKPFTVEYDFTFAGIGKKGGY